MSFEDDINSARSILTDALNALDDLRGEATAFESALDALEKAVGEFDRVVSEANDDGEHLRDQAIDWAIDEAREGKG